MIDIIAMICGVIVFAIFWFGLITLTYDDCETARAIDERVAKLIRGRDHD